MSANYIACEDYNFTWSYQDLSSFRKMWRDGLPLMDIAIALGRHINEVTILVIDQAEQGRINPRENGVFGNLDERSDENELASDSNKIPC